MKAKNCPTQLICKNCRLPNHYGSKYLGYCLECSNAGAPEKDDETDRLKARVAELEELTAKPPPSALAAELERALPILKAELEKLEEAKRVSQAAMRMEFGAKPPFDPVAWLRDRSNNMDCCCQTSVAKLADGLEAEMKEHK